MADRITRRFGPEVDVRLFFLLVVGAYLLTLSFVLSGCGCPERTAEATRLFSQDVQVVLEGAAPVSTITGPTYELWERARRRVLENAPRIAELHR